MVAHPVGCGREAEGGEAREVGGGGEEVEVGVDFGSSADAGSASAVAAAHEVGEFAFDLGSVGSVVGLPVGVGLSLRGLVASAASNTPTRMVRPPAALVHWCAQRAGRCSARRSRRCRRRAAPRRIATVTAFGHVTVSSSRSMANRSLANRPPGADGGWVRQPELDVVVVEVLLELAGPVGRVAVDLRPVIAALVVVEEVVDEVVGDGRVTGVAGRDGRVGDDLAVGIDRDVTLVAVEAAGRGLVAVTGVGIDGGDDPVLGDLAGDAEPAVVAVFEVLADHRRQQLGGLGRPRVELAASSTPRHAQPSAASSATSASRAAGSSQSQVGLPPDA